MPFVRAYEDFEYQRLVTAYLHDAEALGSESLSTVNLYHVHLARTFDSYW